MGRYEVGYKKPPKQTRFLKGRSGNPQGRPKGTKNLKTDFMEELQEQILIREGALRKQVSKQRAMVKSLLANAVKGDTRAADLVLKMFCRFLEVDAGRGDEDLTADELAVLETFEANILRKAREETGRSPRVNQAEGPRTRPQSKDKKRRS